MRSMELNLVHVTITQRDVKSSDFGLLYKSRNGSRNSTPCSSKARLSFEKTLSHTHIHYRRLANNCSPSHYILDTGLNYLTVKDVPQKKVKILVQIHYVSWN